MLNQQGIFGRFRIIADTKVNMTADCIKALEHQLNIVERAAIDTKILDRFRSVPISVISTAELVARYRVGSGVEVGTFEMPSDRPIVLHELMHAFHHSGVRNGFGNGAIIEFYERALRFELYPPNSYVLKSVQEFFAITATCLTHGSIKRPPYTRENLNKQQPNYYRWLSDLMGLAATGAQDDEA